MKNIIKKAAYGIAFPLAFAAYSHAQDFDAKSLDSFFSSGKTAKITELYNNMVQERSKVQTRMYNLKFCPQETAQEDNFDLRYMAFNEGWGRAQFFLTNKNLGEKKEQIVVGGGSMKISTNTASDDWNDPQQEIGHSNFKTSSSDYKTIRTYDFFLNKLYGNNEKKYCLDINVLIKDEKMGNFGDFLPKK